MACRSRYAARVSITTTALFIIALLAVAWWLGPGWRPRPQPGVTRARPWTVGHRGARHVRPENTLAAFDLAFEHLDGIETDVQRTRDGVLILWHDFTLHGAPVRDLTLDEAREREPDLATLDDLFRAARDAPGTLLNLEVKSDPRQWRGLALERDLVRAMQASGLEDRILVSSFDPLALLRVRLLAPAIRIAVLTAPDLPAWLPGETLARILHADAFHPNDAQVTQALLDRWHRRGLPVHVWTVNDPTRMRTLAQLGAGAIMADDPERLAHEVASVRTP